MMSKGHVRSGRSFTRHALDHNLLDLLALDSTWTALKPRAGAWRTTGAAGARGREQRCGPSCDRPLLVGACTRRPEIEDIALTEV